MQFLSILTLFAASASAFKVLTPALNSTVSKGSNVDVKWSSVDTDASTFSIYLVNFQTAHWPPTVLSLAQNVPHDLGSLSVRIPCDVSSDYGWQLNFINGTNTYVIYAQSPVFTLTGDCIEPTPSSSATYGNKTVTDTATVTATANFTATATKTATTTIVSVVETVVYENPVVWFVQPTNLVSAAAICPGGAQTTVTVYVHGTTPAPSPSYGNHTTSYKPTSSAPSASSGIKTPTGSAPIASFTGAASVNRVGSGFAVIVAGVAAMLM